MRRAALGLVVIVGCGYARPPAIVVDADRADAPADADPDEVHGSVTDTFWDATGSAMAPHDLSAWTIAALVPATGSAGRFTSYPGAGSADGTFRIPGVPDGVTYELVTIHDGTARYDATTQRAFTVANDVLGRPNPALTTTTTNLVLNITGLAAYRDGDLLEVFCVNNGGSVFFFDQLASSSGAPAVGDQALTSMTFDWSQPYGPGTSRNPLITGDDGDTLDVIQESSVTQNTANVATIARIYPTTFNQHDGASSTITGAFTAPATTLAWDPSFKRSVYEAYRAEVNPTTLAQQDNDYTLDDSLEPAPAGHGQFSATLDLAVVQLPAGTSNLDLGTIQFGDPFSTTWAHVLLTRVTFGVSVAVDGGTPTSLKERWSGVHNLAFTAGTTLDSTISPEISPPLAPQVNGQDAFTAGSFATTSAVTLTWQPPTVATAAIYNIVVYRAQNPAGDTTIAPIANLSTTDTQFVVPPTLFTIGGHYLFTIFAQDSIDGSDFEAAPLITGVWTAQ